METILVVGATGNIGVSVILASLRAGFHVLAIVRNQASADKMFQHIGTKDGITIVEADVMSDDGVNSVVEKVRAGKLPTFQHVHSSVGTYNDTSPIQNLDMEAFRKAIKISVEANFAAYKATVPYLIEQGSPNASWTLITGAVGEVGYAGVTAVLQGALYSLANVACLENAQTNVRFNEMFLGYRVDFDSICAELGTEDRMSVSQFSRVYDKLFADKKLKGERITVMVPGDVAKFQHKPKLRG